MKARQSAIELVRYLINVTGIPADRVVTHNNLYNENEDLEENIEINTSEENTEK